MYHPVVWYCVATFAVNTVGDKGVFKQVSTHLAVVFSARGEPNMSTSSDFTNKPVEHYQLFPLSCSVGSSSYRQNKFFVPFPHWICSWQVPWKFSSEFSLNSYHRLCRIKFQQTEWFFKLSHHFMPVLYSRGKRWNYFTNFELLFTILFLLLSYQHAYVNANTICNYSVHLTIKCEALMPIVYSFSTGYSFSFCTKLVRKQ
jgi:hypothetical protein